MLSVWLPFRANAGHRGPRRPAPLDAMGAGAPCARRRHGLLARASPSGHLRRLRRTPAGPGPRSQHLPSADAASPRHRGRGRSSGDLVELVGTVMDVTERKRAEEARAYLAAIIASSADAIVGKTLDSVITSWNEAAERMFGYTAAEAVGQQIYLIIPPERHGEEGQILARRSEEHTSELQSLAYLVCRLLLEKKKKEE